MLALQGSFKVNLNFFFSTLCYSKFYTGSFLHKFYKSISEASKILKVLDDIFNKSSF